jgi:hypothetical protein
MHATSGTGDNARVGDAFPALELTATSGQPVTIPDPAGNLVHLQLRRFGRRCRGMVGAAADGRDRGIAGPPPRDRRADLDGRSATIDAAAGGGARRPAGRLMGRQALQAGYEGQLDRLGGRIAGVGARCGVRNAVQHSVGVGLQPGDLAALGRLGRGERRHRIGPDPARPRRPDGRSRCRRPGRGGRLLRWPARRCGSPRAVL